MAAALGIASAGAAVAVSSGGYDPAQQDCSKTADATSKAKQAEPGCHSFKVNLSDSSGHRYGEFGIRQTPDGKPANDADAHASGGNWANLLTGAHLYLGADDNLSNGEHDGVDGAYGTAHSANGPSDGGAIVLNWHPGEKWDPLAVFTNPVPVADFGVGSCADGVCFSLQSRRRVVYRGGSKGWRDVYNYDGKTWDPYDCSSGSPKEEQACHGTKPGDPKTMDDYRARERTVYAEPGFQFYEDPDPQSSPIDPTANGGKTPLYPLPAAYVGTCGVVVGGGAVMQFPSGSPVTNKAGQVVIRPTGC
jgi:hypothetical protein